jgi:hypothetical protein
MKTGTLIFEDTPKYDLWLILLLSGLLAFTLILGIVFVSEEFEAAMVLFGVTLFDALVFAAILPRRFQIFEDRLTVLLGGPLAIHIPLSNIAEAKQVSARKVFAYWGSRFATSTHHIVEIVRHKGLNLVISPTNADLFLEQLNRVISIKDFS